MAAWLRIVFFGMALFMVLATTRQILNAKPTSPSDLWGPTASITNISLALTTAIGYFLIATADNPFRRRVYGRYIPFVISQWLWVWSSERSYGGAVLTTMLFIYAVMGSWDQPDPAN